MPPWLSPITRPLLLAALLLAGAAQADEAGSKHLAPGFTARPAGSKLVVIPADMELYSISAGGVVEPRADWTESAQKNMGTALEAQRKLLGPDVTTMDAAAADELAEVITLEQAVAKAIAMHHRNGGMELQTKSRQLDWSMGDAVRALKERTGADYALFTWVRDTYASSERKMAMLALALMGAISVGGEQVAHASLVDLNTGRVVWFNQVSRLWGDLRDPGTATETVEVLLKDFPALK
ncbi:hypothetical protein GCM10028796_00460 [Ramlibacter monticola]|uniref:Uncharacterized protein n=1 Tax=Ramlibacter monticola TaxID=1926872 RepID=A0A936YYC8_9BURK|nr:hypothetical protein [Ramlibacter monticola]MBL0391658.1 hypothetical protein [Ramlibacter monticola]